MPKRSAAKLPETGAGSRTGIHRCEETDPAPGRLRQQSRIVAVMDFSGIRLPGVKRRGRGARVDRAPAHSPPCHRALDRVQPAAVCSRFPRRPTRSGSRRMAAASPAAPRSRTAAASRPSPQRGRSRPGRRGPSSCSCPGRRGAPTISPRDCSRRTSRSVSDRASLWRTARAPAVRSAWGRSRGRGRTGTRCSSPPPPTTCSTTSSCSTKATTRARRSPPPPC